MMPNFQALTCLKKIKISRLAHPTSFHWIIIINICTILIDKLFLNVSLLILHQFGFFLIKGNKLNLDLVLK